MPLPSLSALALSLLASASLSLAGPLDGIELKALEGKTVKLSAYAGKVLLLVNVASQCGYTGQYEGLQALQQEYGQRGLVVIGFPCNDFGGQEPGSEAEIAQFCSSQYKVTFPMMGKISLSGSGHPLFAALTGSGPVQWNFEKFLLSRDHELIARFGSDAQPRGGEIEAALIKALEQRSPGKPAAKAP